MGLNMYQNENSTPKKQLEQEIEVEVGEMMSGIEKYLFDIRRELLRIRHTIAGIAFIFMVIALLQECRV